MDITVFTLQANGDTGVELHQPALEPLEQYENLSLQGVTLATIERPKVSLNVLKIAAGGHFGLHTPTPGFCQIMHGAGTIVLPGDRSVTYDGPGILYFEAGARHGFDDVTEDTLLTICHFELSTSP